MSFDARVGTCAALVASACTTCESAWRLRLIDTASFCASPTARSSSAAPIPRGRRRTACPRRRRRRRAAVEVEHHVRARRRVVQIRRSGLAVRRRRVEDGAQLGRRRAVDPAQARRLGLVAARQHRRGWRRWRCRAGPASSGPGRWRPRCRAGPAGPACPVRSTSTTSRSSSAMHQRRAPRGRRARRCAAAAPPRAPSPARSCSGGREELGRERRQQHVEQVVRLARAGLAVGDERAGLPAPRRVGQRLGRRGEDGGIGRVGEEHVVVRRRRDRAHAERAVEGGRAERRPGRRQPTSSRELVPAAARSSAVIARPGAIRTLQVTVMAVVASSSAVTAATDGVRGTTRGKARFRRRAFSSSETPPRCISSFAMDRQKWACPPAEKLLTVWRGPQRTSAQQCRPRTTATSTTTSSPAPPRSPPARGRAPSSRGAAAAVLGALRRLGRRLAAVLADAAVGLGHRGGRAALRPERRRVLGDAALGGSGGSGSQGPSRSQGRRRVHRAVGADGRLAARGSDEKYSEGGYYSDERRRRRRRRRRGVGAPVQRVQQRRRRRRRRRLGAAVQRVRRVLGLLRRRRQGRRRRRVRRLVQGRRLRRRLGVQGEWWGAPAVGPLEAERRGVQRGRLLRGWLLGLLGWRQEERRVHREPAAVGDGRERHQVLGGDGRQVRVVLQV